MKTPTQLKNLGINLIKSYFDDPSDKNLIQQKFSNISSKTGQYFVPDTLYQKRTPRKNRSLIPFEHVVESGLSYEQLNTFEGGVAVEFVNNDFFNQLVLSENDQHSIFKRLKSELFNTEKSNVAAIIDIRSTGDSSSQNQREALQKLEVFLRENQLKMEDVLIKRNARHGKYAGQGNKYWDGFVYYSIKGGQQDANDSHEIYGIDPSDVQLFNPSTEYAGEDVSNDITLVLLYFAFFSVPTDCRNYEWEKLEREFLEYFSTRTYRRNSRTSGRVALNDYVEKSICLDLVKGELYDPIQIEPILIQDFVIKERTNDSLDITHQASVNKRNYIWDDVLKTVLTPARPTNLFWSKHLSNMMQQDFSLKEYFDREKAILAKRRQYQLQYSSLEDD